MKFSIIIPSFLGAYAGASHNREEKICRAISSAQHQTFTDFEIIVVADGCERTMEIVKDADKVRSFLIPRGKLFSGAPRNKGIEEAKGEYIIYLDIDDIYGENHLQIISEQLNGYDWVWYDDIRYVPLKDEWQVRHCDILQMSRHGTSNVCHKKLGAKWDAKGYAHDFYFVQGLLKYKNHARINTPEYYVCHIPGNYDL